MQQQKHYHKLLKKPQKNDRYISQKFYHMEQGMHDVAVGTQLETIEKLVSANNKTLPQMLSIKLWDSDEYCIFKR